MVYRIGRYTLDPDLHELKSGETLVPLQPQVFSLLAFLIENRGRVVGKEEIFDSVWNGRIVSDSTLNSRVNAARQAFGDTGASQRVIRTFPRRGFRFVAEVEEDAADRSTNQEIGSDSSRPAIAVLPFANLSGDPEQAYFSDGLTEEIITALCRWRRIPVIARNSTFTYKGQPSNIRKVGHDLGARYVAEGSVRKAGHRVRVTVQLINAENGHHIWADRYDRELDDVFEIQEDIAQNIAVMIEPTIDHDARRRITAIPSGNIAAWELTLRGFAHIYEGTATANYKAIEMFERAIDVDPSFTRAHSGLSYCYVKDTRYFGTFDRPEAIRLAERFARRAIQLDEMDAEAHAMMARCHILNGRSDAGVAEARRSVEINPFDPFANNILGAALGLASPNYEEAIPWFERALQFSPLDPQIHLYLTQMALAELGAGRFETASRHAEDAARRNPKFLEAQIVWCAALGHLGLKQENAITYARFEELAVDYVRTHAIYCQDLKDKLLLGLRKAGLQG